MNHHQVTRPLSGAAVEAARAARGLFGRARGTCSRITTPAPCRRLQLAGGSIAVGNGVGRELLDLAVLSVAIADSDADRRDWASAVGALRLSHGLADHERIQMPADSAISYKLGLKVRERASHGRLQHCTHEAAILAVRAISADVLRRDLGLL